jgi:hypothetical protein
MVGEEQLRTIVVYFLTPKLLRTSKVLAGNISRIYLRQKSSYPFSFVVAFDMKHNTK